MSIGEIILLALALVLVGLLLRFRGRVFSFVAEVKVELVKCTWPWDPNQSGLKRYRELIESTAVVIVSTILLAGFVTSSDFVLQHVIGFLTGNSLTK